MDRAYFDAETSTFLAMSELEVLGALSSSAGNVADAQMRAWQEEVAVLKAALRGVDGRLVLEYTIPRLGGRIDAAIVQRDVVVVVEFKIGTATYDRSAIDQVWDYALDLKNFHAPSREVSIVPILVISQQPRVGRPGVHSLGSEAMLGGVSAHATLAWDHDDVARPMCTTTAEFASALQRALANGRLRRRPVLESVSDWTGGAYSPTPSIVEAAVALYRGTQVEQITRSDAGAANLRSTTTTVERVIEEMKAAKGKAIVFVTGVPGAGKTLVGLNIATRQLAEGISDLGVFLSGNGPLVKVLREALARDEVERFRQQGLIATLGRSRDKVKAFVQNVHHYRDAYLSDERPPADHVALFDEAQRAWNLTETRAFMRQKRGLADFSQSEPEFLISCLDRHPDWAVIVCLVGGGQEINRGEAGIAEWLEAIERSFPHWSVYVSDRLAASEYAADTVLARLPSAVRVVADRSLHLATSMRSFRAEHVSELVRCILDFEIDGARAALASLGTRFPIVLTRSVSAGRAWVRRKARGNERVGMVVSSNAQRLKPYAIDVRVSVDPVHWFLSPKEDVRSSYYLEDVATEFQVQGLEVDWSVIAWDADFIPDARDREFQWRHRKFVGTKWQRVLQGDAQRYLKNAYRVLLTRARQGMVIAIPAGDPADPTRNPVWYDAIYDYLRSIGIPDAQ